MAAPEEVYPLASARSAEGKALRERFRYAYLKLNVTQAQMVRDGIDKFGKDTVLRLFDHNKCIETTLKALTQLPKDRSYPLHACGFQTFVLSVAQNATGQKLCSGILLRAP
jgi:hypothetical protein